MPPRSDSAAMFVAAGDVSARAAGLALAIVPDDRLRRAAAIFDRAARFLPEAVETQVAPAGPGWFDSSFDLQRGLDVREGWPADAPLTAWIDAFCAPRGQAPSSGVVGFAPGLASSSWSAR